MMLAHIGMYDNVCFLQYVLLRFIHHHFLQILGQIFRNLIPSPSHALPWMCSCRKIIRQEKIVSEDGKDTEAITVEEYIPDLLLGEKCARCKEPLDVDFVNGNPGKTREHVFVHDTIWAYVIELRVH